MYIIFYCVYGANLSAATLCEIIAKIHTFSARIFCADRELMGEKSRSTLRSSLIIRCIRVSTRAHIMNALFFRRRRSKKLRGSSCISREPVYRDTL